MQRLLYAISKPPPPCPLPPRLVPGAFCNGRSSYQSPPRLGAKASNPIAALEASRRTREAGLAYGLTIMTNAATDTYDHPL